MKRNLTHRKSTSSGPSDLDRQLRARLNALRSEWSLRELAERMGVSHVAVWRFLEGHPLRPATRRKVREQLETLDLSGERDQFDRFFKEIARVLGVRQGKHLRRQVAQLVITAYMAGEIRPPRWLQIESGVGSRA